MCVEFANIKVQRIGRHVLAMVTTRSMIFCFLTLCSVEKVQHFWRIYHLLLLGWRGGKKIASSILGEASCLLLPDFLLGLLLNHEDGRQYVALKWQVFSDIQGITTQTTIYLINVHCYSQPQCSINKLSLLHCQDTECHKSPVPQISVIWQNKNWKGRKVVTDHSISILKCNKYIYIYIPRTSHYDITLVTSYINVAKVTWQCGWYVSR
jgi:hypothetical protein